MNEDDEEDLKLAALLAKHDADRKPMTDAEYEVWFTETKDRIAMSLADPRPALSPQEVREHLHRYIDELYGTAEDAAA